MAKILLTIPDALHDKAKKKYKNRGYMSVSEMYRDGIRAVVLREGSFGPAKKVRRK